MDRRDFFGVGAAAVGGLALNTPAAVDLTDDIAAAEAAAEKRADIPHCECTVLKVTRTLIHSQRAVNDGGALTLVETTIPCITRIEPVRWEDQVEGEVYLRLDGAFHSSIYRFDGWQDAARVRAIVSFDIDGPCDPEQANEMRL